MLELLLKEKNHNNEYVTKAQLDEVTKKINNLEGTRAEGMPITEKLMRYVINKATPTDEELRALINPMIPKPVKGDEGKPGLNGNDIEDDYLVGALRRMRGEKGLYVDNIKGLKKHLNNIQKINNNVVGIVEQGHIFEKDLDNLDKKVSELAITVPKSPRSILTQTDVDADEISNDQVLVFEASSGLFKPRDDYRLTNAAFDDVTRDLTLTVNEDPTKVFTVNIPGGTFTGGTNVTSVDNSVTVTPIVGGFDLAVPAGGIATTLTSVDGSAILTNVGSNYDIAIDWSQVDVGDINFTTITDWDSFITSLTTNWTTDNWDDFTTNFISNLSETEINDFINAWTEGNVNTFISNWTTDNWDSFTTNFFASLSETEINTFISNWSEDNINTLINQWTADNFGTFIDNWVTNTSAGDWDTFITAFVNNMNPADVLDMLSQAPGTNNNDAFLWNSTTNKWEIKALPASGGGLQSVVAGSGIVVDNTDPLNPIVSSIGGGSDIAETVNQTAHGFIVGDIIRSSGTDNEYAKAQANSEVNAEVVGIVTEVTDVDNFIYAKDTVGYAGAGIPAIAAGNAVWLSATVAGAMTGTKPTAVGQVQKPLGQITANGASLNFTADMRGELITSSTGGATGFIGEQNLGAVIGGTTSTGYETLYLYSNGDGSAVYSRFYEDGNQDDIARWEKDTISGHYYLTNTVNMPYSDGESNGFAILGSFVYVLGRTAASQLRIFRMNASDLSGAVLMTAPTPSIGTSSSMFSDGTNLYVKNNTAGQFVQYSVSGTTLTATGTTITGGMTGVEYSWYDPSDSIVYMTDGTTVNTYTLGATTFTLVTSGFSRKHTTSNLKGFVALNDSSMYYPYTNTVALGSKTYQEVIIKPFSKPTA